MIVFFDKENFLNYLKNSHSSAMGADTLRMLKKQLSIHLNFSLDELDEYEMTLIEEFQEGVEINHKLTYGIDKVIRPLKKNSFPFNNGIYLLNDEGVNNIKLLQNIIIGGINEEIDTLKKLIIEEDYSFHFERLIGQHILPNNHLDILGLPFSTLIFVDRYMFKGSEIGGNISLYEYNIKKILENIFINKKGNSKLIFVYQIKVNVSITNPSYDKGPDLKKLTDKIKKITPKHCPTPEIYLIGVPDGYIDDEHDRFIFSDYLRIKSGGSFVYFSSTGDIITDSTSVDFYSLASNKYRLGNNILLNKIRDIVNNTIIKYPLYSKLPNEIIHENIIDLN
jgi:hypothetical protein